MHATLDCPCSSYGTHACTMSRACLKEYTCLLLLLPAPSLSTKYIAEPQPDVFFCV